MTTMNAKYPGKCKCGAGFGKGATIDYNRGTRQIDACPTCHPTADAMSAPWGETAGQRTQREGRYMGYRAGSNYTRFSSGAEVFTNKRGRCEDAPCCGCCS